MGSDGATGLTRISRVLVIGAGAMGSGIAQVIAESGVDVTLSDVDAPSLERGLAGIAARWDKAVANGKREAETVSGYRSHLQSGDLSAAREADLVIEAIVERLPAKSALFTDLGQLAPAEAILASNTSSISVTALATASGRPERFVGLHFFNPVPVLPLVEIVRGLQTSPETVAMAEQFVTRLGKTPVIVQDSPGFVANRILLPMINEAVFTLQDGVADAAGIDAVMKLGAAHPMGPLALADLIGLDVCLDILDTLHRDFGDDKYRAAPLLRRMVAAGRLGRKSGQGFHVYA
ncbi:MAG: 3-hydroxybutyryl-CoA dehydrogenase [Chloroflexia bacterium]|nr:3-hydroxybutyryl-CoA dehydrogenase [Chloroflexia bacterium]